MTLKLTVSILAILPYIFKAGCNAATMEETATFMPTNLTSAMESTNTHGSSMCKWMQASLIGYWPLDGYRHGFSELPWLGNLEEDYTCAADDGAHIKETIPCPFNKEEKALDLGGETGNRVVRFETADSFNFDASDSFTIMARIKPARLKGTQALVVKGNWEWDYGIWLRNDELVTGSHHNSQRWSNGSYRIRESEWHHIAYVYNDGTSKMYVNGRDIGVQKDYRINLNGSRGNFLGFGSRGKVIGNKFKGLMADVAILNEALPPEEIRRIAFVGFCTRPEIYTRNNIPYIAPVPRDLLSLIKATSIARDPATVISASFFTVDDVDETEMEASDGSFDSGREDVFRTTQRPIDKVGVHEVCIWAVDSNEHESDRECYMMPVYDQLEGYIVGSGAIIVGRDDFIDGKFAGFYGRTSFVIKYKENERDGDPRDKSKFIFKTTNTITGETFEFRSRKIFTKRQANVETGDASFQGYGKINGRPSPNGKDYRFNVWVTDNGGDDDENFVDKFRLQIYWTESERGMRVVLFDNDLRSKFAGEILIDPGATKTEGSRM